MITIRKIDHPPVAQDDSYTTTQGKALAVTAPGVLSNDNDPDNDSLVVDAPRPLVGPAHGTLALLHENGSFDYTPDPGFNGSDAFTYTAADGEDTSKAATVTISVRAAEPTPNPNGGGNGGGSGGSGAGGGTNETAGAIDQFDVPPVIVVPVTPIAPSADTVAAVMLAKKLDACSLAVATTGRHSTLIARGLSIAPGNGTRRLLTRIRLRPAGARLLEKHFGGLPAFISADCTTTADNRATGHVVYVKLTLVVPEVEHLLTPPGSFVPDTSILTPAGKHFLAALSSNMADARILRCDGYTAAYPSSPVDARTLSADRADTACRALDRTHLARPPLIIAHGHADPIAPNSNEAGRRQNRRVAVTIIHRAGA